MWRLLHKTTSGYLVFEVLQTNYELTVGLDEKVCHIGI
jgi:hypothetical protein